MAYFIHVSLAMMVLKSFSRQMVHFIHVSSQMVRFKIVSPSKPTLSMFPSQICLKIVSPSNSSFPQMVRLKIVSS